MDNGQGAAIDNSLKATDSSMIMFQNLLKRLLMFPNKEDKFMQMKIMNAKKVKQPVNKTNVGLSVLRGKSGVVQSVEDSSDNEKEALETVKMADEKLHSMKLVLEKLVSNSPQKKKILRNAALLEEVEVSNFGKKAKKANRSGSEDFTETESNYDGDGQDFMGEQSIGNWDKIKKKNLAQSIRNNDNKKWFLIKTIQIKHI